MLTHGGTWYNIGLTANQKGDRPSDQEVSKLPVWNLSTNIR
ncbi:hypothetical protein [Nostoc sp.]